MSRFAVAVPLLLLLCAVQVPVPSAGQRLLDPTALSRAGEQLRTQLLTVFTGSSSARTALRRQLEAAVRALRRSPPVPEPPPQTTALCRLNGHKNCEKHSVRTDDGYLLTVVRIPAGPAAVPVLLLHGDLASSDSWMMRKDRSNMGTVLNEAGYDVWLANLRGNTHSRRHSSINNTDPQFWNFSWHEMGEFDIPAVLDHVLNSTSASSAHIVGHSMSTASSLVMLSQRPEYNAKVRLASLMSPTIRMRRGVIRWASDITFQFFKNNVEDYLKRNNLVEIWSRSALLHYIGDIFCTDDSPLIGLCYRMYEQVLGQGHPNQRLPDYLATFGAYHPAGTSFKCIEHFGAINLSGRFRPLGKGINDPNPPADYNLTAISTPVALYYSANDGIIDPKDVDRLAKSLPNVMEKHKVSLKQFNHVDFMWAKDARELVYERVIRNMKSVDSKVVSNAVIR